MSRCARLVVFGLVWIAPHATLANWGHWRGDDGAGASLTATPPTRWSPTENIKWKARVPGHGSGSPVVWDDRVFVVTAIADRPVATVSEQQGRSLRFVLMCFDRGSGDLRWERTASTATPHEGTHSTNGYASASPCTDGERVYAHFGSQGLYCFTMTGDPVWSRDFGDMRTRASFGEGSSPTLAGGTILVPWDHEGPSSLYALDKRTGETQWQAARDEPTCWATPLVVDHAGARQVVMNGQNSARAYDLQTGEELWRCGGQTVRPAASAVAGSGMVYVGSGFRGAFLGAFTPDGRGDIRGTDAVAWTVDRNTPDIASPLLSGGRLYFYKGKSGTLSCLASETGAPFYRPVRTGLQRVYASPVAAGGHVYLTGRSGRTVVIEDADEYREVADNTVGEPVDATPAPVGDQLFIRGAEHLFCIE